MVYSLLHRYGWIPKNGIIHQSNRRYAWYSIGQPSSIYLATYLATYLPAYLQGPLKSDDLINIKVS